MEAVLQFVVDPSAAIQERAIIGLFGALLHRVPEAGPFDFSRGKLRSMFEPGRLSGVRIALPRGFEAGRLESNLGTCCQLLFAEFSLCEVEQTLMTDRNRLVLMS